MMNMGVMTDAQAAQWARFEYATDCRCFPVKDGIGRWVIPIEEMEVLGLTLEIVDWVAPPDEEKLRVVDELPEPEINDSNGLEP